MDILEDLEVVILAAGKGTRMKSNLPKVLHRFCGESLLKSSIKSALGLNPKGIIVVAGSGRELVEEEVKKLSIQFGNENSNCKIKISIQKEQKGTADAAISALPQISSKSVLIVPGDIPLLDTKVLKDFLLESKKLNSELSVLSCLHPTPFGFGRVIRDNNNLLASIVEERDCNNEQKQIKEINTSIYLSSLSFLSEALLEIKPNNAQKELYLTDIVALARIKNKSVSAVLATDLVAVTGANSRQELSELEQIARTKINQFWMEQGVSFENPSTTYIDREVKMGIDCYLGANTRLKGATRLGDGVVVEGDSLIENSQIGEASLIKLGCYIKDSEIGKNCELGPFAQIRPQSVLEDGVKIGNFVEVKKSRLGSGAKANHLSYIGDADVGDGSNIGAGTIFCNYDGVNKHKSKLGKEVFIGSNSVLVSPLEIADGAYVAAGSAITKNVPSGSLAVARGKQVNIEGWVEKKNKRSS